MHIITKKARLVWKNPYITNGLVAMWDGQWNSGGGIHSSKATVWQDLVGNHDLNLTPTAIESDRLVWHPKGLRHVGNNYDIPNLPTMADLIGDTHAFTLSYLVAFERTNDMKRYIPFGFTDASFGFNWGGTNFFAYMPWPYGGIQKPFDTLLGRDMMFTVAADGVRYSVAHDGVRINERACSDYSSVLG